MAAKGSSSTPPGVILSPNKSTEYIHLTQATKSASISINKLTHDLNCLITFFDNFVTLQDRSTGRTIGIGCEFQGFFHLSSPLSSIACTSMNTPLLIHSRLGHPNISKFRIMTSHFSSLSSIECESC